MGRGSSGRWLKLAVGGILPYPAAREAGVAVGLGTDGAGSNDSLDLLADLKTFALMQRHVSGDAAVLPAAEALAIATGARAPLLSGGVLRPSQEDVPTSARNGKTLSSAASELHPTRVGSKSATAPDGRLAPGAPADFLLLRRDAHEIGFGDLASDLVYTASGSVVDTTVVAGRVLMRGGEVEGAEEIVAQAAERARRLGIG